MLATQLCPYIFHCIMLNLLSYTNCTDKYQSYGGQGVLTTKVDSSLLGMQMLIHKL